MLIKGALMWQMCLCEWFEHAYMFKDDNQDLSLSSRRLHSTSVTSKDYWVCSSTADQIVVSYYALLRGKQPVPGIPETLCDGSRQRNFYQQYFAIEV